MPEQPYGIEVWSTAYGADKQSPGGTFYYWRLYYTSNGQQAATSGYYKTKRERDKYAQQLADFSAITIRDRYPTD